MRIRSLSLSTVIFAALAAAPLLGRQAAGTTQPPAPATPAVAEKPAPQAPQPQAATDKPAVTQAKPPVTRSVGMTRYNMTAGDLNGDGMAESIVYDSDSKAIRITDYSGQNPIQSMGLAVKDPVDTMVVADVDGDGKPELIVGHGLGGYNEKTGPQTDASIWVYRPAAKGDWAPVEVYRKATERPEVTSLEVRDVDGDGRPEILFAYYASKFMSDIRVARVEGAVWKVTDIGTVRMGGHVDAGPVMQPGKPMIVVGRPYGDVKDGEKPVPVPVGDVFILDGTTRIPLPATRGVSAVAVGDLDGDKQAEIVVADGWHSDYGKIARCRIAVISRQKEQWKYDLIEDLPDHIRFEQIDIVDLNGDGKSEIVGLASRAASLGGSVRVYERIGGTWRGMTAAHEAQAFAAADFDGDKKAELVFTGQPPLPLGLGSTGPKWETKLGEEVKTVQVDSKNLVGKPAPALKATEWIGSDPQTLAGLKGKVVMLDFWATWCKPCIEMYPEMRTWVQEFGPQGLVVLGITNHSSQTSAKVRTFVTRQKLPWTVAIDPKNGTHMAYGVSPIPHTILIDRQGVVRLTHVGGGDLTKIKAKVQELLAEKTGTR